ncbi:hypothetical protein VYU27_006006 [Nannochloropsis oceanica]
MNFLLGGGGPVRPNLPPHLMDEGERGADLVEKATSDILLAVDWAINMEVVDALNRASDQEIKREIIRQIRKRLQHRSTRVVHMALDLIETVVKNCGPSVHREVATPKFMASMSRIARNYLDRTGKENLEVGEKAMDLIQAWGEAFLPMSQSLPLFSRTYHELRREGMPFRQQYDETKVPIMTPPPSAPSARGSGQFNFAGEIGGGEGGRDGGEEVDLLKMVETSETMLHEILYSIESSHELGSGNEVLHAVLGQCAKLGRVLQQEIESKVLTGAEDLEQYFGANDQLQATLHLYQGMKDRTIALPLPQEGRGQGRAGGGEGQQQPEKELISFDDDFLVGLGDGGGKAGGDTKVSAAELGTTLTTSNAAAAAGGGETEAPMLAPSRRDSFGRSRRGSRGSAGSRGAGDDLLDLGNLDAGSNANGVGGGNALAASRTGTGAFSSVSSPASDPPQFAIMPAPPADPFASGPPVPILPPPRSLGSPPGKQGNTTTAGSSSSSSSSSSNSNINSSSSSSSSSLKYPSTGVAPQPPSAFFSLPGGVGGSMGGGMGGGLNGGSTHMSFVGSTQPTSSATGMQASPPLSSGFVSTGGGSLSVSQSGGDGGGQRTMYGAQSDSFLQQHQQFAPSSYPPAVPGGWQQQQWPQQSQPQPWQQASEPQQGQRPSSAGPQPPKPQAQQDNPFDAFM